MGEHFPSFPTDRGTFPLKSDMVGIIVKIASTLNIDVENEVHQSSEDQPSEGEAPSTSPGVASTSGASKHLHDTPL